MKTSILQDLFADKLCLQVPLPILQEIYPSDLVASVLTETRRWEQRCRCISHFHLVYLLIAWTMLPLMCLSRVLAQVSAALRWLAPPEANWQVPTSSAWCYRRLRLGATPLRELHRRACQPLATQQTPGAFAFGLHLFAIDGTLLDVADTAENERAFGRSCDPLPNCGLHRPSWAQQKADGGSRQRHSDSLSESPFPQLRALLLVEVGTHAVVGAVLSPSCIRETHLLPALLPSVVPGSLVLCDSGLRSACWLEALSLKGAFGLTRLQSADHLSRERTYLPDGSYLVTVKRDSERPMLQATLTLRIIEYRLREDVAWAISQLRHSRARSSKRKAPGPDQVYRLATTLLDWKQAGARELAACYHERWEVELVIDEQKEHQRPIPHLISRKAVTVVQEAYALLLAHYATRAWMMRSAVQHPALDPDRLSFTQALSVLRNSPHPLGAALCGTERTAGVVVSVLTCDKEINCCHRGVCAATHVCSKQSRRASGGSSLPMSAGACLAAISPGKMSFSLFEWHWPKGSPRSAGTHAQGHGNDYGCIQRQ